MKFQKKRCAKVKIFLNVEFKQSKTFLLGLGALLTQAAAGDLEVSEIQRFGPAGAEQLQARCTVRSVLRRLQGWLVMSG